VSFSRTGACFSQDSLRESIWIFGGVGRGDNNTEPFLKYTFDTTFTDSPLPLRVFPSLTLAV